MALRPGFVVFLPLTHSLHFRKSAHNESSFPTSRTFFLAIRRVHSFTTENFSSPANFLQAFPPFTTTTVPLSRNRFVQCLVVVSPTKRSDSWIVGYVGPSASASVILQSFPLLQIGFRKTTEIMVGDCCGVREDIGGDIIVSSFWPPNMIIPANTETHFLLSPIVFKKALPLILLLLHFGAVVCVP